MLKKKPDRKKVIELINGAKVFIKGKTLIEEESQHNSSFLVEITKNDSFTNLLSMLKTDKPKKKTVIRDDYLGNDSYIVSPIPAKRSFYYSCFVKRLKENRLHFLLWDTETTAIEVDNYERVISLADKVAKLKEILIDTFRDVLNDDFSIEIDFKIE